MAEAEKLRTCIDERICMVDGGAMVRGSLTCEDMERAEKL